MSGTSLPPITRAEALTRTYHVGEREVRALQGVNLAITPGDFVVLRGRSGSGKTTLLNCISGLDRPTSGRVWVEGRGCRPMFGNGLSNTPVTPPCFDNSNWTCYHYFWGQHPAVAPICFALATAFTRRGRCSGRHTSGQPCSLSQESFEVSAAYITCTCTSVMRHCQV